MAAGSSEAATCPEADAAGCEADAAVSGVVAGWELAKAAASAPLMVPRLWEVVVVWLTCASALLSSAGCTRTNQQDVSN